MRLLLSLLILISSPAFGYGEVDRQVEYDLIRSWENWDAGIACNLKTSSMATLIDQALTGIPFEFKDMTDIPGFNKYNVVQTVPKDAFYLTMWKRMTPESKVFFTDMMRPHWEKVNAMLIEVGEERSRSYDWDRYINEMKAACIAEKTLGLRNKRPESDI